MPLLVTRVLGDEVEVLAADDQGTVHLGGDDGAGEDTATDGDETGEGALLVCWFPCQRCSAKSSLRIPRERVWSCSNVPKCVAFCQSLLSLAPKTHSCVRLEVPHTDVGAINGGLGGPEAQADVLVPSPATLADAVVLGLGDEVDVRLLLESTLALDGKLSGHGCCGGLSRRGAGW